MRVSVVGIAWYKGEDYETLKRLFVDGDNLPETYEEWLNSAERLVNQLRRDGLAFQKVYIDPDTFPAWCAAKGLDLNATARTRFSAESVAGKHGD
jgi:hypothetical protein